MIRTLAGGALAAPLLLDTSGGRFTNAYGETVTTDRFKGRVVIGRDPAYTGAAGNPGPVLEKGIRALLGVDRAEEAWKKLFRPTDVVAVKVNALAGKNLSPTFALVREVVRGLGLAGVTEDRIIVWDRSSRELRRAGYPVNTGQGLRVFGTDALDQGYEPTLSQAMSVGSCFSRIVAQYCTAIVNVGVLKDHDLAGISVLLKNFYGAIHNPNKYHDGNCSPYVAHLSTHPYIRSKTRLHLVDAPTAQFHGGPASNPGHSWPFRGILLATDGVAGDRVALDLIEQKRREAGLKSLTAEKRFPAYIDVAGQLGLGEGRLASIQVQEV